jgi:hypothetical protein
VFSPTRNTWLVGDVVQVGGDALTLQLFGYFRASLSLSEMNGTWEAREATGDFLGTSGIKTDAETSDAAPMQKPFEDNLSFTDSGLEWVNDKGHVIERGTRLRFRSLGYSTDRSGITVVGTRFTLEEELAWLSDRRREKEDRKRERAHDQHDDALGSIGVFGSGVSRGSRSIDFASHGSGRNSEEPAAALEDRRDIPTESSSSSNVSRKRNRDHKDGRDSKDKSGKVWKSDKQRKKAAKKKLRGTHDDRLF